MKKLYIILINLIALVAADIDCTGNSSGTIVSSDGSSCVANCAPSEYIESTVVTTGKCTTTCPSAA
jgi:hypothetical protein